VPFVLAADVEGRPFRTPVKWQTVRALVYAPILKEVVVVDVTRPISIEEAEDDLVLGVRLREEVLEDGPILNSDSALAFAIRYGEEDTIMEALDLVLQ
jgi:hypothetical protein